MKIGEVQTGDWVVNKSSHVVSQFQGFIQYGRRALVLQAVSGRIVEVAPGKQMRVCGARRLDRFSAQQLQYALQYEQTLRQDVADERPSGSQAQVLAADLAESLPHFVIEQPAPC